MKLHIDDKDVPITVEVIDVSEGGARLRALACAVRADQHATLRFLLPDQQTCVASGRVARVERDLDPASATFALRLDETNDAFRVFLASLVD